MAARRMVLCFRQRGGAVLGGRGSTSGWALLPAGCLAGYVSSGQARRLQPLACESQDKLVGDDKREETFWLSGSSGGSSNMLAAKFDLYGGVIVDPSAVPQDSETFRRVLSSSLKEWAKQQKRGVWLRIDIELSKLIPIATSEFGFEFHHAERGHLMLTKWLPADVPNTLPSNASHTVGVGAIVTDDLGRLLLVQERTGPAAKLGIWKLPTGLVDSGEELHTAALREVKEETGVDASFECLGAFTMNHGGNLAHAGKSNLFFIVKCKAASTAISTQPSEIAEARWFTREEWEHMPFPEKDSIWDALNRSALDGQACVRAKQLAWGTSRPDSIRWFYYPTQRSAL
eukprot:TRINITY_DN61015_c0_g1_i1.p1 TRINITY_DN61015_c0_g1~~TRINITY_DN61015_c0_g1_i1.p1  ORF type:complete len:344 (-),score=62.40 TRINITY_DN61015_c0_g1_i1:249-1280(-)